MVEISTYNPAPDLEGYKMRIYCFNQEFISCSTNGNDPTPNKILLTRSIYGWDDVRAQWRPPTTKSVNTVPHRHPVSDTVDLCITARP